jgi:hypothetical protein
MGIPVVLVRGGYLALSHRWRTLDVGLELRCGLEESFLPEALRREDHDQGRRRVLLFAYEARRRVRRQPQIP